MPQLSISECMLTKKKKILFDWKSFLRKKKSMKKKFSLD